MVLYQCVAKHLCGMTRTPITNPQHHCMQCRGPFHSAVLCGVLWSERDRSTILIRKVDCSKNAQSLWDGDTAAMCFACVEKLDLNRSEPSAVETRRKSRRQCGEVPTPTAIPTNVITVAPPTTALPTEFVGPDVYSGDCSVSAEQRVEDAKPRAKLATLKSMWDYERITKCKVGEADGWQCGWCNKQFKPLHATRAMSHVLKIPNKGIVVCPAHITESYFHRYSCLLNSKIDRKGATKRARDRISDNISKRQAICLHGSAEAAANASLLEIIDMDAQSALSSVTGISPRARTPTRPLVSDFT